MYLKLLTKEIRHYIFNLCKSLLHDRTCKSKCERVCLLSAKNVLNVFFGIFDVCVNVYDLNIHVVGKKNLHCLLSIVCLYCLLL